jgi:hypothetical protein
MACVAVYLRVFLASIWAPAAVCLDQWFSTFFPFPPHDTQLYKHNVASRFSSFFKTLTLKKM